MVRYYLRVHIFLLGVLLITLFLVNECQTQECNNNEVYCGVGGVKCYPKSAECDGKIDCLNESDELRDICTERKCNTSQFHCASGACIPLSLKCNTRNDCFDGSDEANCEIVNKQKCPNDWQVLCLSGECIRQDQICDGIKDCTDNSDETYTTCLNSRCPSFSFQCKYGACIDSEAVCNGVSDCIDSSDELLPECKTKINVTDEMICGKNSFKCNTGLCIIKQKLCDGIRDCDDGSDETYRQCRKVECGTVPRCDYGACGGSNCVDGSNNDLEPFTTPLVEPLENFSTAEEVYTYPPIPNEEDVDEHSEGPPNTRPPSTRPTTPRPTSAPVPRPTSPPAPRKICIFPQQPDHGVVKTNTGIIPKAFEAAPAWTILIYSCNEGYSLGAAPSVIVCMSDQWTNPFPKCLKTCPKLTSENHEIECLHEGRPTSCESACEGTIANIKCKEAFEIKNFVYQPYNGIECSQHGNWSDKLFDCNPECGTLIPKAQALVVRGYAAGKGEFPWHSGIYRLKICDDEHYEQICGGTLISEKIIISAAHCFWDWNENKPNLNIDKYAVAVGKFYRTWNSTKDKHAQYSGLKNILLPTRFRAEESTFANDIAILILNNTIKFTSRVRPVCVDWSNDLYKSLLKPGALGTVVGWGLTEEFGNASEELQAVRMPYVEYDKCVKGLPDEFKPFITNDKICAGYNNGTSVCTGDSGGGLAFKKSNRYFIQGVVSVAPAKGSTCDSYRYAAFTSIPQHLEFITRIERSTY